jgi:hypothetical protein
MSARKTVPLDSSSEDSFLKIASKNPGEEFLELFESLGALGLVVTVETMEKTISRMNNEIAELQHAVLKKKHNPEEDNATSVIETDTSYEPLNTPTMTAASEDFLPPLTSRVSVPWGGETYVIRERKTGRMITLADGKLQLQDKVTAGGGHHWICTNKNGWFGFRNSVSGRFMGHNAERKFHCKVFEHKSHEWFTPRAHPDGGYWLTTLHENAWRAMGIGQDGKELVEVNNNGTAWEFVKV